MSFGLADVSIAYVQNFIYRQGKENEKGNPYDFSSIWNQKGIEAVQGVPKAEEKELQEDIQLTKEQEMELFQREFWKEVAAIPKTSTIDHLAINITDKGWERMKEEPEYRKQMMELIQRDTTGSFIHQVDSVITIGATDKEYRASSWSSGSDEFQNKVKDDSYIEAREKRKKELKEYYEKLWLKHFYEQRKLIKGEKNAGIPPLMSDICSLYESLIPFF